MRLVQFAALAIGLSAAGWAQSAKEPLKSAAEVLDRYQQALGGPEAIRKIQSETVHGEIEATGISAKATFVYYAKPFKTLIKVKRPDGSEVIAGFDGQTSWTVTPQGATLDTDTPVESVRRDADLQYPLHEPDYFQKLELAGVTDFEGHHCYWLHGTTHWGKDNNQFYDVGTGLLAGYRFQTDDGSGRLAIATFEDFKDFGGPLVATRNTTRVGDRYQTFIYKSISYDPLPDSTFDIPPAVKALMH